MTPYLFETILTKKGITCYPLCPRCNQSIETVNHLFMTCPIAAKIWFGSQVGVTIHQTQAITFKDWIIQVISNMHEDTTIKIIAIIYGLWQDRDLSVFEGV